MNISGHTQPFAVVGHPIGHTLSPVMHNASFAALGLDAIYLAFDVKPERLMAVLPALRSMGFGGVNLTIPHKEVAFRGLEKLDASALLLGAVNTVQFSEGGMIGHNTDGFGFLRALDEAFGRNTTDDSVFVLGSGGAGRAVALMAAQAGAPGRPTISVGVVAASPCALLPFSATTEKVNWPGSPPRSDRDQDCWPLASAGVLQQ